MLILLLGSRAVSILLQSGCDSDTLFSTVSRRTERRTTSKLIVLLRRGHALQFFVLGCLLINVNASSVAAGVAHTCVIMASGGVRCWGLNTYGQVRAF